MKNAVVAPMISTVDKRGFGQLEQRRHARDHEDAGRHHRCSMDQRGDRRRTFHRVRQPDVQGHLRRLTHRTDEQADADATVIACQSVPGMISIVLRRDGIRAHRTPSRSRASPCSRRSPAMPSTKPKSPTRLTRKALRFAKIADRPRVPETDQQVRDDTHRLPAEEQLQEVVRHHEHQHRERKQRDVREEALIARDHRACSRSCRRARTATRRSRRPSSAPSGDRPGSRLPCGCRR